MLTIAVLKNVLQKAGISWDGSVIVCAWKHGYIFPSIHGKEGATWTKRDSDMLWKIVKVHSIVVSKIHTGNFFVETETLIIKMLQWAVDHLIQFTARPHKMLFNGIANSFEMEMNNFLTNINTRKSMKKKNLNFHDQTVSRLFLEKTMGSFFLATLRVLALSLACSVVIQNNPNVFQREPILEPPKPKSWFESVPWPQTFNLFPPNEENISHVIVFAGSLDDCEREMKQMDENGNCEANFKTGLRLDMDETRDADNIGDGRDIEQGHAFFILKHSEISRVGDLWDVMGKLQTLRACRESKRLSICVEDRGKPAVLAFAERKSAPERVFGQFLGPTEDPLSKTPHRDFVLPWRTFGYPGGDSFLGGREKVLCIDGESNSGIPHFLLVQAVQMIAELDVAAFDVGCFFVQTNEADFNSVMSGINMLDACIQQKRAHPVGKDWFTEKRWLWILCLPDNESASFAMGQLSKRTSDFSKLEFGYLKKIL